MDAGRITFGFIAIIRMLLHSVWIDMVVKRVSFCPFMFTFSSHPNSCQVVE